MTVVHDVIGVGFGPANLALAAALSEDDAGDDARLRALFFEREPVFAWHPGMLLDDARMQVSFLKDLVTLRNPRSRFSFLNYLWTRGRLDAFINLEEFRTTRREFNDYLRWAADQVAECVRYEHEVTAIEPRRGNGADVGMLTIQVRHVVDGRRTEHHTRNVVLAAGGTPVIPPGVATVPADRIFHSRDFLPRIQKLAPEHEPYRFVVVGEGQSAAEIFDYLISHYPRSEVTAAMRGIAYRPMDDSSFVNEIFFPGQVDFFYGIPEGRRQRVFDELRNTNWAVVDLALIDRLYRKLYDARLAGRTGIRLMPFSNLRSAAMSDGVVRARFENLLDDRTIDVEADVLVLATGYASPPRHPLLEPLLAHLETDEAGRFAVDRRYRIAARPGFRAGVFLQGYCAQTHGIADTLLSIMATRSGDIVRGIRAR